MKICARIESPDLKQFKNVFKSILVTKPKFHKKIQVAIRSIQNIYQCLDYMEYPLRFSSKGNE